MCFPLDSTDAMDSAVEATEFFDEDVEQQAAALACASGIFGRFKFPGLSIFASIL